MLFTDTCNYSALGVSPVTFVDASSINSLAFASGNQRPLSTHRFIW